ncbi:MAG: phosphoribosylformylglycinamidine synthase subunit PurL [Armatimonadetes bacterium]|nr:phosphoribosylformylglycinamidine synthase subunit PurL [Armatimonadota bacterium]
MSLATQPEVYTSMGLTTFEYELIVKLLGREPTYTELGMFSVMWSEHCGYKYSRPILSLFAKYKEAMEGDGLENAGVVDIGDGLGITMKVESHNHPSAVEPYQGAATGVGGIIRDILTMGARPIAGLNSLRFGPIEPDGKTDQVIIDRNKFLFEHVVQGIGGYGNCVGVPTVGGEVGFHPKYSGNPLVNAMCVGLLETSKITTAAASGVGNPVIYLGSSTGKDGIHGATFASDALDDNNQAKRPNVQIGDPFAEKQLIEATLEALETGAIVAIQDMGAAGLTCSTVEMASKGAVGMSINLDKVPMRERDMAAYELMLSESQERMLAVAHKGREGEVLEVFHRWGLNAVVIGEVTADGQVTVTRFGKVEAKVDPKLLTDHCPVYQGVEEEPDSFRKAAAFNPSNLPNVDPHQALLKLLGAPEITNKRWVYEQYDTQVQTQTIELPGDSDAAVLAPRGTKKGISVTIDGNERLTTQHPRRGGRLAVVEAARNVACSGAMPTAVTDGLNFGSPQNPVSFWQFAEAVRGIAEAAEAMGTPVISGNVSFYNHSDLGEIPPTPMIGMLGVIENAVDRLPIAPPAGSELYLVQVPSESDPHLGLGASAYAAVVCGVEDGYPANPSLKGEKALAEFLVEAAKRKLIVSAHDSSQGGPAVALAELALKTGGLNAELAGNNPTSALFGEIPGDVVIGATGNAEEIETLAKSKGLSVSHIGKASGSGLTIGVGGKSFKWNLSELKESYENALSKIMTPH